MPQTHCRMVRLTDIAEQAGVSRFAVAKVLLGTGKTIRVGEGTARKIRRIAEDLGYFPDRLAQQLAGKRSRIIGVIIDSGAPQAQFDRLSSMERVAASMGYRLMVGQSHGELDRLTEYAQDFASRRVDGVICISHDYPDKSDQIVRLFTHITSLVFVGSPVTDRSSKRFNYVESDIAAGIRDAVAHLVQGGRRRIAMLLYSSGSMAMQRRLEGYRQGLADHQLPVEDALIDYIDARLDATATADSLMPRLGKLLDRGADALLAVDDRVAAITLFALKRIGRSVPGEVAVVGVGNTEWGQFLSPSLTSIDQCAAAIAQATVQLLVRLIEQESIAPRQRHVMIQPELVVRESG